MTAETSIAPNVRRYLIGSPTSAFSLSTYHLGSVRDASADGPNNPNSPDLYMRRWIFHTPWGSLRLHHVLRSDHDRDLHDHPMDFATLLLTGGYFEVLPAREDEDCDESLTVPRWRRWLSARFVAAETPHRLVLMKPVWTLVWAWPKRRKWGFYVGGLTPSHWVSARDYLGGEDTP